MKRLFLLAIAVCTVTSSWAQFNPQAPIPADKEVRVGKLSNGMSYYIRHNEKPKGQADFYIIHDVGAIQENDAQQGLAHFLEHMAFNGTKNLPGKMLTEYLETIGVKFGANLNAGTGFDQTTYMITDVPVKREGIIDSALLILHDWSSFISLEGEEIDSERGVISEELRTRDGAQFRSMIEMIKALGKGTKYEHRNLIGYLDGLKNFKHQELVDFYHQWYRPDYQALVIVGDINVDSIEAKIKALMADIPAPEANASIKENIVLPNNEQPIVSIYTDPEMQGSKVQIYIKGQALPKQMNNTGVAQMIDVIKSYAGTMQNARLQEIAQKPDAPFLGAGMHMGNPGIVPTLDATIYVAVTQDGKLNEGIEAIYTEMEKVRRFGFTQSEFDRAQEDLMRSAERSYTNRNDRANGDFIDTYVNNFSKNSSMADAQTQWQLDSMIIKNITLESVNGVLKQVMTPENQVFYITAPQKEGVVNPTEEQVLAIRAKVAASELVAHTDNTVKEPLIADESKIKGSKVKKTIEDKAYGTTEWILGNGVSVVVKPTTYKADEIRMVAQAKGGLSVLSDEEFYMGEVISSINSMSGIGKFTAAELRKQLAGKSASVSTALDNYASVVHGVSSPKDLVEMLQLTYLTFTQPRFNEDDYNTFIKMMRSQLDNVKSNPDYIAEEKFTDVAYGNNPRRQMISPEIVDKFDFKALPAIYKKLFPDAASFKFVIVGNVDLATLKPLVEKYLGSIPSAKKPMTFVDDKAAYVKGQVSEDFTTPMQQPKVSVRYMFAGDLPYTIDTKVAMSLLNQALNSRYLVSIREEKGGTYGVQVGGSTLYIPKATYELEIKFDTNEQMADELCQIVIKEIEQIATNGPKSEDIEKAREFMLKSWANSLEQNGGWMRNIQSKHGSGLDYVADYENVLKTITGADVQALAKKILEDGNQIKVVMRPAKTE